MKFQKLKRCKLEVKPSRIQGYGVFALEPISGDEIIEECYYLHIKWDDDYGINYAFNMGDNKAGVLPLGYGTIYNHSSISNAYWDVDKDRGLFMIVAERPIKPGEEIFLDYGGKWFASRGMVSLEYVPITNRRRLLSLLWVLVRFAIVTGVVFCLLFLIKKA
jgi:hypothetical protein